LYAFAPFRIAELFSRTSMPSHMAYAILPLLWCGLYEIVAFEQEPRGIAMTAISAAMLFLTTIPLTVGTAAIIVLAAGVERKRLTIRIIRKLAVAVAICVGLCAYQLISVALYRAEVHFSVLFRVPDYLILDLFKGVMLPAVYHYLLLYGGTAILIFVLWWKGSRLEQSERTVLRLGLALFGLFLFFDTPLLSEPAWRLISTLAQGTWRNYIYFLLFDCAVTATARTTMLRRRVLFVTALWTIGALLPILLVLSNIHMYPHDPGRTGDTPEYLPKHSNTAFLAAIESPVISPTDTDVVVPGPGIVTFHRFWWPGWHLYAGNSEITTWPDSSGRACAYGGSSQALHWRLEQKPLETAGLWISGLSWASVLVFLGIGLVQRRVRIFASSSP
ncbi:MAG: hypothetical protein ACHQNE_02825, partial [Candidatus Kapaibacterium sp.]